MGRGPTQAFHKKMNDAYVDGTLTCLKPGVIKERINIGFPLVLNVEPTNACNLKCIYCPRGFMVKEQGIHYLPLETFKEIINETSGYGRLIMLNLHKDGEPLLHKRLPEMIAYAKKMDIAETIHLNTNGTLLGMVMGRRMLEAGLDDVTISIDAACRETYSRLKRDTRFDALIQGIETFIAARDALGAHTFIRVKIMEFDGIERKEINRFIQQWEGVADEVQVTGIHDWSGAIKGLKITDECAPVRHPCALLWYALAVNSNGKVSVCNVDWDYSGVVGDINKSMLHHIWNDEPIRRIRRAQLESDWCHPDVCKDCVLWTSTGDLRDHLISRKEFIEPL